jgi:nucleoside 2-deoxyribosyltransferase
LPLVEHTRLEPNPKIEHAPAMDEPLETLTRPRIYLAGPDVFRPDARDHFVRLAAACEALGLVALLPADGNEEQSAEAPEKQIYEANMQRLRSADGVVANLASFRGLEPDSGTVFEVGAAVALQIPVVAYGVPAGSYADRARSALQCAPDAGGVLRERGSGIAVEDFGQPLNLMLACSIHIETTPEAALRKMAAVLAGLR